MSVDDPQFGVFLTEFPTFATAPAREAILQLSAERLGTDAFVALLVSSPDAVALRTLDLRPSILAEPALWQSDHGRSSALVWLGRNEVDDRLIVATVRALVAAGQPVTLSDIADRTGGRAIDAALDVLGEGTEWDGLHRVDPGWISTLRAHPKRGVSWLARSERPSAALAKLVLDGLRPGDRRVRSLDNDRWVEIAEAIDPHTSAGTSVYAFALGVGFHDERPSASLLVSDVYQSVHDSAEEGRLADEDWDKLKRAFPRQRRALRRLTRDGQVGRGRVLRRAVVEAFGRRNWPITDFLGAVSDSAVLARAATENLRTKSGKALARRLNAAIQEGGVVLNDLQRTALNPWIDS